MIPEVSAFSQLPQLLRGVLRLDPNTYTVLATLPQIVPLTWLIVLTAGLSEALGHAVVLFINRVKPRRFVMALLLVGLSWSLGFVLWFASIWVVAVAIYDQSLSWVTFIRTLGFACVPLCGLFLTATPYLGGSISVFLNFYSLLCMIASLEALTTLKTPQALACVAFGWLALQVLQRTVGRPMIALGKLLERRVSGTMFRSDRSGLAELVSESVEELQTLLAATTETKSGDQNDF